MEEKLKKYIKELELNLRNVDESDRNEILTEIRNHIYEAVNKGESIEEVLSRMGTPKVLSQAYLLDYKIEKKSFGPTDFIRNFSFYLGVGSLGALVISIFGFFVTLSLLLAILLIGTALTNFSGITTIPMFVWGSSSIAPGVFQIVLASLCSLAFVWIAVVCWKEIRKCIKKISQEYRNHKMEI
ncbi:DUF1700 domain-containing protein [Enterococcus sp. HY326]|uniref:DUF1700 domain-containing protein n=1 Tax=Enterococcus sp. HY326 TaxID=2971265 RepID=UPI00223F5E3D|nr:DUF1700 domain-containing protein [Enterococcus sp. HY326]